MKYLFYVLALVSGTLSYYLYAMTGVDTKEIVMSVAGDVFVASLAATFFYLRS